MNRLFESDLEAGRLDRKADATEQQRNHSKFKYLAMQEKHVRLERELETLQREMESL